MNGILALGIQDFKRLLTNALFWVITATLVAIIAVVNFALPKEVSSGEEYSVYTYSAELPVDSAASVSSEEELRDIVRETGGIGILGKGDGSVTVLNSGLSEKTIRSIMVTLYASPDDEVEVERLIENTQAIPFNKHMTPVFICFEALIIGFILGGALMLSEKEGNTIRALRISPMGADRYIVSKTLLFSVIGTIYALLMAFFCVGFGFPIVRFILLSFFGAAVYSLIGIAFTTFFRDMSSWFFSMAFLLSFNMLPIVAYSTPSFSPIWIRVIPSYPMIFAYENILFGTGGISLTAAATLFGWCAGAYVLSRIIVKRFLLSKGGR